MVNHLGVYPYLLKFRNSVFQTEKFNSPGNRRRLKSIAREMYECIVREPISDAKHTMYIGGVKQKNVDKNMVLQMISAYADGTNPTDSVVIVPSKIDISKLWWLDNIVAYTRGRGNHYGIVGETRLNKIDLKKVARNTAGWKSLHYPFEIRDSDYSLPFQMYGNPMPRCVPHQGHGSPGSLCFGNYQNDIMDCVDDNRWDKLAAVLIEFAGRFNPDDVYGEHYQDLMERIPMTCAKCGTRRGYIRYYQHNDETYCANCYRIGSCIICSRNINLGNVSSIDNVCQTCKTTTIGSKTIVNTKCECGTTDPSAFYINEKNEILSFCESCINKKKFQRFTKFGRFSTFFRRTW